MEVLEKGPKKWAKEAAFVLLSQKKIHLLGTDRTKKLGLWMLNE